MAQGISSTIPIARRPRLLCVKLSGLRQDLLSSLQGVCQKFRLNGTIVTTSLPGGVLFFSVADGGGFDLYPTINNISDVGVISLISQ
jgi:hypothetical protein